KALSEKLPLLLTAFGEGQCEGRLDGFQGLERSQQPLGALVDRGPNGGQSLGATLGVSQLRCEIACPTRRLATGHVAPGNAGGPRRGARLVVLTHGAVARRVGGFSGPSGGTHPRRLGPARQSGQSLRAARAGDESQLDFRLADQGGWHRDTIV